MKKIFALVVFPLLFLPQPQKVSAPLVEPIPLVEPQFPISHRQDLFLGLLEWCESGGYTEKKILDSNNKYSYGSYMFQMDTFLRYGKIYDLIPQDMTAEKAESSKLIYDYDIQTKLTHRMLLDKLGNNWKTCYNGIHSSYPKK